MGDYVLVGRWTRTNVVRLQGYSVRDVQKQMLPAHILTSTSSAEGRNVAKAFLEESRVDHLDPSPTHTIIEEMYIQGDTEFLLSRVFSG
jgi:hypothetical protein